MSWIWFARADNSSNPGSKDCPIGGLPLSKPFSECVQLLELSPGDYWRDKPPPAPKGPRFSDYDFVVVEISSGEADTQNLTGQKIGFQLQWRAGYYKSRLPFLEARQRLANDLPAEWTSNG